MVDTRGPASTWTRCSAASVVYHFPNYKQPSSPRGRGSSPTPAGTAMGAMLELDGALVATFPGVPHGMKVMFGHLGPLVRGTHGGPMSLALVVRWDGRVRTRRAGPGPSGRIGPPVAPLAGQGQVRLRITARAATPEEADKKIEPVAEEILSRWATITSGRLGDHRGRRCPAPEGEGRHPGPCRELHRAS